ncbi:MAG: carbon-nitrogen hydrolase family protein [Eubacterium sp.]|nr:carbon-nitrogen hydrolase family protein [Eubacterium sp.]
MRIAAFQFGTSGNIEQNMVTIERTIEQAAEQNVELILFPECALTGYPPKDIPNSKSVGNDLCLNALKQIKNLSKEKEINIIIGAAIYDEEYYNPVFAT